MLSISTTIIIFAFSGYCTQIIYCIFMSGISFSSLNSLYSFLFLFYFQTWCFYRKTFMFSFYDFDVLIHYFHQHLDFAGFGHCIDYLKIHPMTVHCKSKYLYAEIKMSINKFNLSGLYHRKMCKFTHVVCSRFFSC